MLFIDPAKVNIRNNKNTNDNHMYLLHRLFEHRLLPKLWLCTLLSLNMSYDIFMQI